MLDIPVTIEFLVSFGEIYPKGHFDHKVQTATISIPKAEIIKNISQIKAGLSFLVF